MRPTNSCYPHHQSDVVVHTVLNFHVILCTTEISIFRVLWVPRNVDTRIFLILMLLSSKLFDHLLVFRAGSKIRWHDKLLCFVHTGLKNFIKSYLRSDDPLVNDVAFFACESTLIDDQKPRVSQNFAASSSDFIEILPCKKKVVILRSRFCLIGS
jgi:hypothetical protein